VRRRVTALALALAVATVLAGCGVPTGGAPETIAPSDIPYGLTSPSSTSASAPSSPAREDRPRIYLVDEQDVLVSSGRDISGTTIRDRLADLLGQLAAGPTAGERDDKLTTALPPATTLGVDKISGDVVTVELGGTGAAPSGQQSRRAVGQIVLTATSLPQVRAVVLTRDGRPLEAPLPSGELTSDPLTAEDYASLLIAPPS
jgi:Sporulation and spore germination